MPDKPVIIVGTTPDYVSRIYKTYPETTLFVLDPRFQGDSFLDQVDPSALLFTCLENFDGVLNSLLRHLSIHRSSARAVACFDCEYLILASNLARYLGLPFPSADAIARARNKFSSRRIWKEVGLQSPKAAIASGLEQTLAFFRLVKKDIVLKPISASGSELLFHCRQEEEILESVQIMQEQLPKRRSNPLFRAIPDPFFGATVIDPCGSWVVEEFVSGPEFSCDFILHDGKVTVIRETGKIKASGQPFGSVLAYTFPPEYPERLRRQDLPHALEKAARALGFTWGYFMVDFIIQDGDPSFIEIAPRPGGDSIPDLVEIATGFDILGLYLDLMCGKFLAPRANKMPSESLASINLYGTKEGVLTRLDPSQVLAHSSVKALFLKKKMGDKITLPPDDYDNRLLGYCIVTREKDWNPRALYEDLRGRLKVSMGREDTLPLENAQRAHSSSPHIERGLRSARGG